MTDYKFHWLMTDAGFKSISEVASFFDVTEKTVIKWKKNEKPPKAVSICLMIMSGQLSVLGDQWKGFKLTPEAIESPEGDFIYSHEVRAIRYVYQSAGLNRSRICNMLKFQTPIKRKKPPTTEKTELSIFRGKNTEKRQN